MKENNLQQNDCKCQNFKDLKDSNHIKNFKITKVLCRC